MLLSVFGGTSTEVCPATVTLPGLYGCLYCRWLPSWFTFRQPSRSITLMISRTFIVCRHRASNPYLCDDRSTACVCCERLDGDLHVSRHHAGLGNRHTVVSKPVVSKLNFLFH